MLPNAGPVRRLMVASPFANGIDRARRLSLVPVRAPCKPPSDFGPCLRAGLSPDTHALPWFTHTKRGDGMTCLPSTSTPVTSVNVREEGATAPQSQVDSGSLAVTASGTIGSSSSNACTGRSTTRRSGPSKTRQATRLSRPAQAQETPHAGGACGTRTRAGCDGTSRSKARARAESGIVDQAGFDAR